MATSGVNILSYTVDEIITEAFEVAAGFGVVINAEQAKGAIRSLNLVLKDIENRNFPLAKRVLETFPLVSGTNTYTLPDGVQDVSDMVAVVSDKDLGMVKIPVEDYIKLSSKTTPGRPTQYAIQQNRETSQIYLYPTPNGTASAIKGYFLYHIQKVKTLGENLDINSNYFDAVINGLAHKISLKSNGADGNKIAVIKALYEESLELARLNDRERTDLVFTLGR